MIRCILFFLSAILLPNLVKAQEYRRENYWPDGKRHEEVVGRGNDSLYVSWYESGLKREEGRFMYGKMIGTWTFTKPDGKPLYRKDYDSTSIDTYKNRTDWKGKLLRVVMYDEAGNVELIENYNDNKRVAITKFYASGKFQSVTVYNKNEEAMTTTTWFESGSIKEVATFNRTLKIDKREDKEVAIVVMVPTPFKAWHDNGQLAVDGQEENGKPTGEWMYYDPQGNLTKTVEF